MPKNSPVFPFKDRSELTEQMQLVYDKSVLRRGEAKLISAMARAPELFDWYIEEFYNKLFYSNNVPKIYKELGRLRLSQVHGCRSCNKGNRLDAKSAGLDARKIAAISDRDNEIFNAAEKAVLQLADLMSLHAKGARLSKTLYEDLLNHFDEGQIIELSMTFSLLAGMAHFLFAFEMVELEDVCEL